MASDGTFLYWVDQCATYTVYLRRMSLATKAISTFPGSLPSAQALTIDAQGRVLIGTGKGPY